MGLADGEAFRSSYSAAMMWLLTPSPFSPKGFGERKKRKIIDMDERVVRDRKGKLTYTGGKGGKGKGTASSSSGGKVKASVSQAGPSQPAAKKAKR